MTQPDYYIDLAFALREAANKIETLAGSPAPEGRPNLYLTASYVPRHADTAVPVVDAIAAVFGAKAETKFEGRGAGRRGQHSVKAKVGVLTVISSADLPVPPTRAQKLADLQRENDELRAKLASAGGQA